MSASLDQYAHAEATKGRALDKFRDLPRPARSLLSGVIGTMALHVEGWDKGQWDNPDTAIVDMMAFDVKRLQHLAQQLSKAAAEVQEKATRMRNEAKLIEEAASFALHALQQHMVKVGATSLIGEVLRFQLEAPSGVDPVVLLDQDPDHFPASCVKRTISLDAVRKCLSEGEAVPAELSKRDLVVRIR